MWVHISPSPLRDSLCGVSRGWQPLVHGNSLSESWNEADFHLRPLKFCSIHDLWMQICTAKRIMFCLGKGKNENSSDTTFVQLVKSLWSKVWKYQKIFCQTRPLKFCENSVSPIRVAVTTCCINIAPLGIYLVTCFLQPILFDFLQEMTLFLRYANYVFTAIFIVEGVVKIYALGFKKYIKERYDHSSVLFSALLLSCF